MFGLLYVIKSAITIALVAGAPQRSQECCMEKTVGGIEYRFIGEAPTSSYNCLANCLYERENAPGSMYCFAEGDLEVECEDEQQPTDMPENSPEPTDMPENSPEPTDMPENSSESTDKPEISPEPTDMPENSSELTDISTNGPEPTDMPENNPKTTDMPEKSPEPTNMPETSPETTDMPTSSPFPNDMQSTPEPSTSAPSGGGETTPVDNSAAYCALNSEHTMCKYKGPSADCSGWTLFAGLSAVGKQALLDKHNEQRKRVAKGEEPNQPAASDMRKLVWNDELATIAQRLTDQCIFGHDDKRNKLDDTYVGQNLYTGSSSVESNAITINAGIHDAATKWYDEVTEIPFDKANISPFVSQSGTGHYTQNVWAETEEVGCGLTYYKKPTDIWYTRLVACNYAKGGNFIGATMYTEGTACTNCPSGYTCEDGLCVAP